MKSGMDGGFRGGPPRPAPAAAAALVIRLTALGDVALTEPVIRALRARYGRVDLLTEQAYAAWAAAALGADATFGYDRRGRDRGLRGLWAVRRRLVERRYRLVVDLQGKLRTRVLAATLGAPRTLTWRRRGAWRSVGALFGYDRPDHGEYAVDAMLRVVAPVVALPRAAARVWLRSPARVSRPSREVRIGVCPGGSTATKRWPPERFGRVVRRLAAAVPEARFVAIGGPDDRDRLAVVKAEAGAVPWLGAPAAPAAEVGTLGSAVAGLDLLISNDTGPAHLARGYGVPCVVIFGPTSWLRWARCDDPFTRIVRAGLDCAPCSNYGGPRCPRRDRDWACMTQVSEDAVFGAAEAAWAEADRPW